MDANEIRLFLNVSPEPSNLDKQSSASIEHGQFFWSSLLILRILGSPSYCISNFYFTPAKSFLLLHMWGSYSIKILSFWYWSLFWSVTRRHMFSDQPLIESTFPSRMNWLSFKLVPWYLLMHPFSYISIRNEQLKMSVVISFERLPKSMKLSDSEYGLFF